MKKVLFLFLLLYSSSIIYGIDFSSKVKTFTLSNGMKFFIYERHSIPSFAGAIMVKVGSVDEREGITGLAHFFEHMAFKGTSIIGTKNYKQEKIILEKIDRNREALKMEYGKGEKADQKRMKTLQAEFKELQIQHKKYIIKDEMSQIYMENGGESLNATTSMDTTQYFVKLPSNRLELWFIMESGRFKYPVLREFYREKDVVLEEKKMSIENDPDGFLSNEFHHIAFILHPYRHPILGYTKDILSYTKAAALNFFKTYYIPCNMTAALVGDVEYNKVKRLAEKYFGNIPAGIKPPEPIIIEPKQKGEKRITVEFDAEPRIMIGYHMPPYPHRDNIILEVISCILTGGESSRLHNDLVIVKKLSPWIVTYTGSPGERFFSLFKIYTMPRHPIKPGELESAIYRHLEKLKNEPVPEEEIEKVINHYEASFYRGLKDNIYIALRILRGVMVYGDINAEFKKLEIMKSITLVEIMETSKRIFHKSNRTVAVLVKK